MICTFSLETVTWASCFHSPPLVEGLEEGLVLGVEAVGDVEAPLVGASSLSRT